mgnify:FL=1
MGCSQYLLIYILLALASVGRVTSSSTRDASSCGYDMDGLDDYASFSIGSRNAQKMTDQGFTMMFWLRNKRKDKDGHFEQCLMSHSYDDHAR